MKTKCFHRFLNRIVHFEADIELVDVLNTASARGALNSTGGKHMFDDIAPSKHPRLAVRPNTAHARQLAINHLYVTLLGSFIKDIYEDAFRYFSDVLEAAVKRGVNPGQLVGDHQTNFKANDLLAAGSWNNVVALVSSSIFRALENEQNTRKLLDKLDTKLGLDVDAAKVSAALPYFEMRHLLVHADGVVDEAFCKAFPGFKETAGVKLKLSSQRIRRAHTAIVELIDEFDQKLISKGVVANTDCAP